MRFLVRLSMTLGPLFCSKLSGKMHQISWKMISFPVVFFSVWEACRSGSTVLNRNG